MHVSQQSTEYCTLVRELWSSTKQVDAASLPCLRSHVAVGTKVNIPSLSSSAAQQMVHQLVGQRTDRGLVLPPRSSRRLLLSFSRPLPRRVLPPLAPPVQERRASAARQQGCLPSSATFPSRRLGLPGTSPTSAAQIRERKTARPATIPQRHCLAVKQRDSTEAGPPGAPPPSSPHRLSMGAPSRTVEPGEVSHVSASHITDLITRTRHTPVEPPE